MKQTLYELEKYLRENQKPLAGTRWIHNKTGNHYNIVGRSFDCDTNELRVHYINLPSDLETPTLEFSRPLSQWEEQTEFGPRFSEVKETRVWVTKDQKKKNYNRSIIEEIAREMDRMPGVWNRIPSRFRF